MSSLQKFYISCETSEKLRLVVVLTGPVDFESMGYMGTVN